jgi:predicted ATP-dependent endonuclease of OLD family
VTTELVHDGGVGSPSDGLRVKSDPEVPTKTENEDTKQTPEQKPITKEDQKKKKRRTKVVIEIENKRMVELLRAGASDRDVKQELQLTDRVYRQRMDKLSKGALEEVIANQSVESKALLLKSAIEKIQALELQANNIAQNARNDTIRMAAMDRVRQYAIDIAKLLSDGPDIFKVFSSGGNVKSNIQRPGLYNPNKGQPIKQLPSTAILSESGTQGSTTGNQTEQPNDPNRVA